MRTFPELVAAIIEVNPDIELDPFIAAASLLVDRIEEDTASPDESVLTQIETWLSAHFYAMRDPRLESERAGDVWATYQSKVGFNLALSHYGQMAMVLDPTGTLKQLNMIKSPTARKVGAYHVGGSLCDE